VGYAERRGDYWRGRYRRASGQYGTVADDSGRRIRFRTKREAEVAANDVEAAARAGSWRDPAAGRETFGEYVNRWYAVQDLAASTMENYRRHIESHLLPKFESHALGDISSVDVASWAKQEHAAGYAPSSVKTWRSTLHLILSDAVEEGLISANPAAVRRGRGRRAGRSQSRGPEKVVTDALGLLLIAERAALLSGRDDEFVAIVLKGYTGIRFGELVGLETEYVRPGSIRVEWQLFELGTGELIRCPPKDDSHRTIDAPEWLGNLVAEHISRAQPKPCLCHGRRYVFGGHRAANGVARHQGPTIVDVARRSGVSTGTVSNVLNRPESVPETTREKVGTALLELGYIRGGHFGELAAHWRRSGFGTWLFQPAATGRYAKRATADAHPVPVLAEPWPGIPARGRGASARAEVCWVPIAPGLTPHGLRHSHKTMMLELGVPSKLMDERLGHADGSVQARYSHVSSEMRRRLLDGLTELWNAALEKRRAMNAGSPVTVLDNLLKTSDSGAEE
jgi:integrase